MATPVNSDILIVDDDPHFRESLEDALETRPVRTRSAANAEQAMQALKDKVPSAILLDVKLPDMRGLELCRRIKEDPATRGVPVIILSGAYTEPADRADGLMAGAECYLSKPFRMDTLFEELDYVLDKPAS